MQGSLEEPTVNCKHCGASWKPGVTGTLPDRAETRVPYCTAGPRGTQESSVTQWDLMEASVHCDTAGPDGTQESSVTQGSLGKPSVSSKHSWVSWDTGATWILPGHLELSVHCDTAQPHGNMGTIGTIWNLTYPRLYFARLGPHGTQVPLGHCQLLWIPVSFVTQHSFMKTWGPL